MRCTYCGSKKHTETNCPKTAGGQAARRAMRCGYCGAGDHTDQACPKIRGRRVDRDPDAYVLDR